MNHGGARAVQGVENEPLQVNIQKPEQPGAKRCRAVHNMCQDDEKKEGTAQRV